MFAIRDRYEVSKGHTLVITKRHVETYFDADAKEHQEIWQAVLELKSALDEEFSPAGYNVGFNARGAAGQTVPHLHVHIIPRYEGDVEDPTGGIRGVIPHKANYIRTQDTEDTRVQETATAYSGTPAAVYGSESAPLLDELLRDLAEANAIDIVVAFVKKAGLERLVQHLGDVLQRNGRVRFLTGDYLAFTEPDALVALLDLTPVGDEPGKLSLRVFETTKSLGFHPKAYLLPGRAAYVGSSNLTRQGLIAGIEWNLRIDPKQAAGAADALAREFEGLFAHPRTRTLTAEWVRDYRKRYKERAQSRPAHAAVDVADEPAGPPASPHSLQQEALQALAKTRAEGNRQALVVMATGLGKTWLAAFDVAAFMTEQGGELPRVLFLAHRDEILRQAQSTFRRLLPEALLGLYTGPEKRPDADVIFASIQTFARVAHLRTFAPDAFDYVIVDEFHHAAARTYTTVLEYLHPKFLLGLTATPDRMDGADLLAQCGHNLVYDCDLARGIRAKELSPFHYFGVPDEVEYDKIPWRSGRFDREELERRVETQSRAQNAFEQWQNRGGNRTLGFCVSQHHADFMASFFKERGVEAVAVHSGPSSSPRTISLERLRDGELQVLFAVDIFNEGVDVPTIDTVLMLRPTESRVIWLQQLGRGLRKAAEKAQLLVVDYIGNHRTFLQGPMALFPGLGDNPVAVREMLQRARGGPIELAAGCLVTYELEAIEVLEGLIKVPKTAQVVENWYDVFRERHGRRPTAGELWRAGNDPKKVRKSHGGWFGFVRNMGDLTKIESRVVDQFREFLEALEVTDMTRAYKMIVLLSMVARGRFSEGIKIDELAEEFAERVRRSARLRADSSVDPEDLATVKESLKKNPIKAWTGGKGTGGVPYFRYSDDVFAFDADVPKDLQEPFQELVREVAEWRLSAYLEKKSGGLASRIVCSVSHNQNGPILFLPSRNANPGIPSGWFPVLVGKTRYEFNFVTLAVNVVRKTGGTENVIGEVLRGLLGPDTGASGRRDQLRLELEDETFRAYAMPESGKGGQ